jgi:hypothetical protein
VKIRYEVTVDDLVAFTFHRAGRSLARRRAGGIVWTILAMFALFVTTAALMGQEEALGMLVLVAVPIGFLLAVMPKAGFRPNTERSFRKLYQETLPRGEIGPHEVELTENCLVERTPYSERRTPLQDVQGVTSDGDRTFLSIGPVMAYVIPHRSISEGDLQSFIDAVRMRMSEIPGERPAAEGGRDAGFP